VAVVQPLLTPDDVARLIESGEIDRDEQFELVDGEIVWLVSHENRTVRVYQAGKREFTTFSVEDEIALDAISAGFQAPVSAFFPTD